MKSNNCSWNDSSVEIECTETLKYENGQLKAKLKNLEMTVSHCNQTMEKEKVDWTNTCNDEKKNLKEENKNLSYTIKEREIEIGSKNNKIDSLNNHITSTNITLHRTIASKDSKIDKLKTKVENLKGTKSVSVQYAINHVIVTHHALKVN